MVLLRVHAGQRSRTIAGEFRGDGEAGARHREYFEVRFRAEKWMVVVFASAWLDAALPILLRPDNAKTRVCRCALGCPRRRLASRRF